MMENIHETLFFSYGCKALHFVMEAAPYTKSKEKTDGIWNTANVRVKNHIQLNHKYVAYCIFIII